MNPLHTLMGFSAIVVSTVAVTLYPTSALAGPAAQELNAYTFPASKVVGIPGACRMIQTGSNPEKEAECAEWGRKFKENGKRQSYGSSTTSLSSTRKPIQTLSCYTTGGVYSNLGDCR